MKSKALDILLSEAVALGDPGRDVVRRALPSFEPLEVMPNLIRFLREARARGHAAWQVFFDGIDRLIEPGFRAYEDRPADAERFRGEILPLFAELLTDGRLDDWVKEQVVRIVRIGATPLGGGLKAVVAKLGKFSGVAAEGVARRIYDAVLRRPESNRENREAAAEWATEHPSKVELSSSPKLTSPPSLEKTIPVSRMDAPQEVSLGSDSKALSSDLTLSSCQFGEDVDLAQAAFVSARPTTQVILTDLEQMQIKLAELHAPIVERLRSTIEHLHQVKSLGSYDENAKAATMVYRLAKSCGMDLTYKGERVALGCIDREDYKAGVFRLRTFSGKPKFVYDRRDFPPLDLSPSDDPTSP